MTDTITPRILIVDPVGLIPGPDGAPDVSAVAAHVAARGGLFVQGSARGLPVPQDGRPRFHYMPDLSTEAAILAEAGDGLYQAVIAAATFIPEGACFALGGVRIGAGTANMKSASWGGGDGRGGIAPLMNTPGINARATAQMVMKALLRVRPDLPVEAMHARVAAGQFDTGRDLASYPTAKLEGRTFAVIGYGNIGREVAKLARAFGMRVRIFARPHHRDWIESEGFDWAETPLAAAQGADVLSVHLGLGAQGPDGFANAGLIGAGVLAALAPGAVLINYDRGELVDTAALTDAMAQGRVAHAAIDADLFRDAQTGALSGPMLPYLALVPRFGDRLSLLPHAAADTDHPTRVAGAIQAVDQILDRIGQGVVRNLKGDLPAGLTDGGRTKPAGLGGVTAGELADFAASGGAADLSALAHDVADLAARAGETGAEGAALVLACNRLVTLLRRHGIEGPYLG